VETNQDIERKDSLEHIYVGAEKLPWNVDLQIAKNMALAGSNMFVSGAGGVGKTVLIKVIAAAMGESEVLICASTGCAAYLAGGATVHSAFGIPETVIDPANIRIRDAVIEKVSNCRTIIVDEISMVREDVFIFMARVIREAERRRGSKIQLIVVGDFFQLEPVLTEEDKEDFVRFYSNDEGYAFLTKEWWDFDFRYVPLTKQLRVDDMHSEFAEKMLKLREGDRSCINYFNSFRTRVTDQNLICLMGTNKKVNRFNAQKLKELPGRMKKYPALGENHQAYKKDFIVEEVLKLKVGAKVMVRVNGSGVYNGMLAEVVEMGDMTVTIKTEYGEEIELTRYIWEVWDYNAQGHKVKVGTFEQFPLSLAYAITIHKSQGMTLRAANIDPRCFAAGQLYVAISRVSSPAGLHLIGTIHSDDMLVSGTVQRFYSYIEAKGMQ